MKEVYPFDFELYISYRLKKNVIEVEWEIKNQSEETIYFTIGGHPAIHFAKENETKADYRLYFPEKDHLNYILVDIAEGGADPKKVYEMKLEDGYYPLTEELFERDALIFDENQIEEVWISHKDGTPYVGMKCEGFQNFGIWSARLCSMTTTVFPPSASLWRISTSLCTSSKCNPVVGSSRI